MRTKLRASCLILTAVSLLAVAPRPAGAAAPDLAPCRNGYVSISFDDGPTASTPALLRALHRARIKATFFNAGNRAQARPFWVWLQARLGHQVGNHTYDHPDLTALGPDEVASQLEATQRILTRLTGAAPSLMRPPYGAIDEAVRAQAARLGLTEVIWTADTVDWSGASTAEIVERALAVGPGGFALLHDGYPNTIAAVPLIARGLAERGLCAGRIVASDTPTQAWEGLAFPATVAPW